MIVIVDYGIGNVGSIYNMLRKVGAPARLGSDPETIASASKLILPGIGHFDAVMSAFNKSGLRPAVEDAVRARMVPILGICVGMQMMARGSDEGQEPGLGWIEAQTRRFDFRALNHSPRLPHIGWNYVRPAKTHTATTQLSATPRFYFVHSFHVACENPADILLQAHYGVEFTAAFAHQNMLGVQFHPEKSHKYGMQLLRGFAGVQEKVREPLSII
jgi:glutamine amidotransferase